MDLQKSENSLLFELKPKDASLGKAILINKRRLLIGSSESCDVVLPYRFISAIHAVMEVSEQGFKLYDMNSKNNTLVNGKKIVAHDGKIGDVISFAASYEFIFKEMDKEDILPPPLEILDPLLPPMIEETEVVAPPVQETKAPELPKVEAKAPPVVKTTPSVKISKPRLPKASEYPLATDPKADFCEYIFEDADTIYPIFTYGVYQFAAEVIILFKDKVFSVDYIPFVDGTYYLVGSQPRELEIEYAYLGRNDRVPLIEIKGKDVAVHHLVGFESLVLSDQTGNVTKASSTVALKENDILRYAKDDLQIYIRKTEAPPHVKPAPFFRRDKDLKKYLVFVLLFLFTFGGIVAAIGPETEDEKQEKAPERVVSILQKERKKLYVAKKPAIAKTKDADPSQVQKSPQQTPVPKPDEKGPATTTKKPEVMKKAEPKPGPKNDKIFVTNDKKAGAAKAAAAAPQAQGHVDTYKASADFSSTVSSLLSRGGGTKSAKAVNSMASGSGDSLNTGSVVIPGESARLERAKVTGQIGSIYGSATGKIDAAQGVQGLVDKKGISVVGVPSSTVVMGGMDPDIIRRILMDHIAMFRNCYQSVLDKSSEAFDGVIVLDFVIGASGNVSKAGASDASGSMPPPVRACVLNVLKGIKFPEPPGGGTVGVRQPMNFQPNRK